MARLAECDSEGIWRAKQEAEPGAPLPSDFPYAERLAAAGYTTQEDLDGADEEELRCLGFQVREAQRILAALAAL